MGFFSDEVANKGLKASPRGSGETCCCGRITHGDLRAGHRAQRTPISAALRVYTNIAPGLTWRRFRALPLLGPQILPLVLSWSALQATVGPHQYQIQDGAQRSVLEPTAGLQAHIDLSAAQVYVAPHQWSFPLDLPIQAFGIFPAGQLREGEAYPWQGELDFRTFSANLAQGAHASSS